MIWLIILGIFLLLALVGWGVWVYGQKKVKEEPLTFRRAATLAKTALLDTENKPDIFKRKKGQQPVPFVPAEQNKAKADIPGSFLLRWPDLELRFGNKEPSEELLIKPVGKGEEAIATFYEGKLTTVELNGEPLDMEDFEMRHAGTIAEQLRMFVRHHLRFPGGSLIVDKMPDPTFKPTLNLRKGGEIKLHGKPPPGRMPNYEAE